jgi:hypothetical protein
LTIKGIKPQGKPWTLFSKETPPQADGVLKTLIKFFCDINFENHFPIMGNNYPKIRVISFQVRKIVLENLGVKPWRLEGK